jgi:hypothetical protein
MHNRNFGNWDAGKKAKILSPTHLIRFPSTMLGIVRELSEAWGTANSRLG